MRQLKLRQAHKYERLRFVARRVEEECSLDFDTYRLIVVDFRQEVNMSRVKTITEGAIMTDGILGCKDVEVPMTREEIRAEEDAIEAARELANRQADYFDKDGVPCCYATDFDL